VDTAAFHECYAQVGGGASLYFPLRGIPVWGRLTLTQERLTFRRYWWNLPLIGAESFGTELNNVAWCYARFSWGVSTLSLQLSDGREYELLLYEKGAWLRGFPNPQHVREWAFAIDRARAQFALS
jgi:hypothetical protein